jgi:hypothetical protein
MASIPLALSIHHFINSVGSDAGFASIIGLAVLILLYFTQARETASLRDYASEATGRIQQLEARVAQLSRSQATGGATEPAQTDTRHSEAPAAAPVAAQPVAQAQAPVAPAGVAAPALTAATRLIPTPVAAAPPPPAAQEGSSVAVADRPGSTAAGPPGTYTGSPPATSAGAPPPATVAGGANGATQAPSRPAPRPSAPVAAARRPGPATMARPPQRGAGPRRSRLLMAAAGALGVAVIVAVLLIVTSSGGTPSSGTTAPLSNALSTRRASRPGGVAAPSVTVAVLNGTASNGLAHRVAQKLTEAGYKQGMVETAPEQTHTSTIVGYLPGFRRDAQAVAASLKLSASAIQPIDQNTQAVACPPPASCATNVVVTVGADLTNTP